MTEQDRELLELAAKAAGYEIDGWDAWGSAQTKEQERWNPLADDGDEARLEALLQMHVIWEPGRNTVVVGRADGEVEEPYGADRQAARRRAGVRAAAEIGRNMP